MKRDFDQEQNSEETARKHGTERRITYPGHGRRGRTGSVETTQSIKPN